MQITPNYYWSFLVQNQKTVCEINLRHQSTKAQNCFLWQLQKNHLAALVTSRSRRNRKETDGSGGILCSLHRQLGWQTRIKKKWTPKSHPTHPKPSYCHWLPYKVVKRHMASIQPKFQCIAIVRAFRAFFPLPTIHIQTVSQLHNAHCRLTAILPVKPVLAVFPLDFPSLYCSSSNHVLLRHK